MKVALIRPPEVNPYWVTRRTSLGVSYLASYLISKGIDCRIFDANFHNWTEEETLKKIVGYHPNLIGISSMTHEIILSDHLAGQIKKKLKKVPVVIGGCHLTALPKETMVEFSHFDYGIYGEGEKTLLDLAKLVMEGKQGQRKKILSLVYRDKENHIVVNPPAARLTADELNSLPYPAYDQYYAWPKDLSGKNDYYVIMASRGCPYNCAFCMRVLGRQVRRRSPESIIKEMEYALKRYKAHTFQFCDEIFLFNDRITFETLALIKKRFSEDKIRWQGLTRANLVTEELIKAARQSGCYTLDIGIESGNDEILKRIDKRITTQQAEKAVGIIKKAGISVSAYFILGHPGETVKTIKDTIKFAARLNPNSLALGIMVPYPGTRIYEMAKNRDWGYRLLNCDWSKYDKYGGRALELKGLPLSELEKWQRRGFLYFYIKNLRIWDLFNFVLKYRREIISLLIKQLSL